ncbi:MAG: hypothetical protein ABI824_15245, partial [Acidobacteriota bacterium]
MKRLLLISAYLMALAGSAGATEITYVFNTGANLVSIPNSTFPPGGPSSPDDSTGHSLGLTVLSLGDPSNMVQAALTLTGSGILFCASPVSGTACASLATSEAPGNPGHASGLGVADGRVNVGETLTIQVLPGFVVKLVQFQTTALIANIVPSDYIRGLYNIGGGDVTFFGTANAVDTYSFPSSAFSTLIFGAPPDGPSGSNSYAL